MAFAPNNNTTANLLNGGSTNLSVGGTTPQPAANPQADAGSAVTNGLPLQQAAPLDSGTSGIGTFDPNAARANALKGSLKNIVNSIYGAYDAIYGDIGSVAAEKAKAVGTKYNKESTSLVDQYNTDFPQIGNAYGARGTYDSSYRQDAEAGAQKQYNTMQDNLVTGRDEGLAQVGQWNAQQTASVNADKTAIQQMQALIDQSTDPAELESVQNQLNQKMAQLSVDRQGMRSQDSYRAEANALVNTTDASTQLSATLSNVMAGAAPAPLKRSVAMKLIQSSGLPADQQAALVNDFDKQLSGVTDTTQQVVA